MVPKLFKWDMSYNVFLATIKAEIKLCKGAVFNVAMDKMKLQQSIARFTLDYLKLIKVKGRAKGFG